jgi:hypothetical protein
VIRPASRTSRSVRAAEDADRAVELARPVADPQILLASLATSASTFVLLGNERRAAQILDEALAEMARLRQLGFVCVWLNGLGWAAWWLGRGGDFLAAVSEEQPDMPWFRATRSAAEGDFGGAAAIFGGIGARSEEAFYRLRHAEQLVSAGRRTEADAQLAPALAFYRSAGASRYLRKGEALLAAAV